MSSGINTRSCAVTTRLEYLHSTTGTGGRLETGAQAPWRRQRFLCSHAAPYRRGFAFRIATRQQKLRRMRRKVLPASAPVDHQRNCPFDRSLVVSQNPWPSYARMRSARALRLRKMNRQPENGSEFSFSPHS